MGDPVTLTVSVSGVGNVSLFPRPAVVIAWGDDESTTTVAWLFTPRADGTTFVSVTNAGFQGDEGAIIRQVIDATEGFTLLLAGLKAFLEHRIQLNLVADRFPTPTEVRSEK